MRQRPSRAVLAALVVVIILLVALLVPKPQSANLGPYGIRTETLTIAEGGDSRKVILCTPRRLEMERLPLILAFRGVGDSPRSMQVDSKLDKLVGHGRCTVAFLEGRRGMWATEGIAETPLSENRDVRFVCAFLDELPKHARFDESRVYAVGMSNGATFAKLLSLALPCRVAATVGHSGGLAEPLALDANGRKVPVFFIVGDEDVAADWVREAASNFHDAGHEVEFTVREDLGHEWGASQNGAIWDFLKEHRIPEDCIGGKYPEVPE